MKKYGAFLLIVLMVACFAGCSNTLSEKDIEKLLPDTITCYMDGDKTVYQQNVDKLEIIKQKADKSTQFVECEITLSDTYFQRTVYADLYLTKYDKGGWQIDTWSSYASEVVTPLTGPSHLQQLALLTAYGYSESALSLETENISAGETYTAAYQVNDCYEYADFTGTVDYTAYLCQNAASDSSMAFIGWDDHLDIDNVLVNWNILGTWRKYEAGEDLPRYAAVTVEGIDAAEGEYTVSGSGVYGYPMWDWDKDELSDRYHEDNANGIWAYNESNCPKTARLKISVDYCNANSAVFYFTLDGIEQEDGYVVEKM